MRNFHTFFLSLLALPVVCRYKKASGPAIPKQPRRLALVFSTYCVDFSSPVRVCVASLSWRREHIGPLSDVRWFDEAVDASETNTPDPAHNFAVWGNQTCWKEALTGISHHWWGQSDPGGCETWQTEPSYNNESTPSSRSRTAAQYRETKDQRHFFLHWRAIRASGIIPFLTAL